MRIAESARRHGVDDEDMMHAARNATVQLDDEDGLTMMLGAGSDGSLLEVGVLGVEGDDPVIIHAMPLRAKYYSYLG